MINERNEVGTSFLITQIERSLEEGVLGRQPSLSLPSFLVIYTRFVWTFKSFFNSV
jgi:hypothetical protein